MAQGITRFTADTVSLSRYEYVKKNTNNGSDCICSVVNTSMADLATVVMTGAPDSMEVSIDSMVTFNGTHILQPGQQVIAVGNFMGKQVVILNLSPFRVSITVMVLCPD